MKEYGFLQSYSDYSLFTYTRGHIQLNVLVYVDDLIISGNDSTALNTFKSYLSDCFHMKDLGTLKYFLGIEVARSSAGIFFCAKESTLWILFLKQVFLVQNLLVFLLNKTISLACTISQRYSRAGNSLKS